VTSSDATASNPTAFDCPARIIRSRFSDASDAGANNARARRLRKKGRHALFELFLWCVSTGFVLALGGQLLLRARIMGRVVRGFTRFAGKN
jgi:hypothetical protein